jgi:dCTP deaminase
VPDPVNCSSTSLDLHLDEKLQVWRRLGGAGARVVVDPSNEEFNVTTLANQYAELANSRDGYDLEPGTFVLGWTLEAIQLPHTSRLAARVEGKSSLARLGMGVHVTAPTIHAGFGYRQNDVSFPGNPIQLEIFNLGPLTIKLTSGMKICQLILEEVHGTPSQGYGGQFSIQGPS